MINRKLPGPDLIQGFWLKTFRSLESEVTTSADIYWGKFRTT